MQLKPDTKGTFVLEQLTDRQQAEAAAEPFISTVHRWVATFLGLQLAVVLAVIAAAIVLHRKLDDLGFGTRALAADTHLVATQVTELNEQTRVLKAESLELRQFVASSSAEQVIFLKILILKPDVDPALARAIAKHVHRYAGLYGKEPELVLAIIAIESRFDANAVSPVGAVGLMQVMPQWVKVLGISGSLKDPEVSIKYGIQVLGFYVEMYKDIEMALTAYNRGPGPVDAALMRGRDPKNTYAPQVIKVYERLKKLNVSSVPQ